MLRIVLAAALSLSGAAGGARPAVLEREGVTATVAERPAAGRDPGGLEISVSAGGRTSTWSYRGLALDPAGGPIPVAEILPAAGRDFLFVHTVSGGAGGVWSLLVFDLERLRPVGTRIGSQGPIPLVTDRTGCEVGAIVEPVSTVHGVRGPAVRALYCFDGARFTRKGGPAKATRPRTASAP